MNRPLAVNLENLPKARRAYVGSEPSVLTEIYEEEVNIAVWRRHLSEELISVVDKLLSLHPKLQLSMTSNPRDIPSQLFELLGDINMDGSTATVFVEDMSNVVNMFCCLFDLRRVGLRLAALDKAMCPRFHVDRVPARLATTYSGVATEWLPHSQVDRRMLGVGSKGQADNISGLYLSAEDIQQLNTGDVAILKGESWEGNEHAGLVHRSPEVKSGDNRLLLTLDFIA